MTSWNQQRQPNKALGFPTERQLRSGHTARHSIAQLPLPGTKEPVPFHSFSQWPDAVGEHKLPYRPADETGERPGPYTTQQPKPARDCHYQENTLELKGQAAPRWANCFAIGVVSLIGATKGVSWGFLVHSKGLRLPSSC